MITTPPLVIAVDGPAASGKGTIAKLVALIHEIEDGKRAMSDDNLLELIAQ